MNPLSTPFSPTNAPESTPDDVYYEAQHPAGITVLRHQHGADLVLQVVPLDQVIPHERYHGPRVADLAARLAADGRLINPPLAVAHRGKYIILDGATRLTAFRYLNYPHIILQLVDILRQQVELHTWYHVVRGGTVAGLLDLLAGVEGLHLVPQAADELLSAGLAPSSPGALFTADGRSFRLDTVADYPYPAVAARRDWLDVLTRTVDAYGAWGGVDRTISTDMELLTRQYPDLVALVVFPRLTPAMILDWAAQGRMVPAGITRFVVPGRILRLNAPLAPLAAPGDLEEKRQWLDALVREKLVGRQVRYYEEPVVLLDE